MENVIHQNKNHRLAKLVYDAKDRRSIIVRALESLTAFILTAAMWIFLIHTLYIKLYVEANDSLEQIFFILFVSSIGAAVVLGGWQFYNWQRFHKKQRRKAFPPQSPAEVARIYGISEENMMRLQAAKESAAVVFRDGKYYYCIKGEAPIEIGMLGKE